MVARLPPLESLRVLEACARHANFTRAAAELGVTAAAVSLRIRNLEAELGVALFARRGPQVRPTAAASAIASAVAAAMGSVRAAIDDWPPAAEPIRLTAPPTFAANWLSSRLGSYHALEGAAPVRLDASPQVRAADAFDLAVRTGVGPWSGLEAIRLGPVQAAPMLSPALAARRPLSTPADLLGLPLLPHPDWKRWFRACGLADAEPAFYASDHATSDLDARVALDGSAVALLPPELFADFLADGRLVQPFPQLVSGPEHYHLLRHPGEARPAVVRFCGWLQAEAEKGRGDPIEAGGVSWKATVSA